MYNLYENKLLLFDASKARLTEEIIEISYVQRPELEQYIGETNALKLREDIELIEGVYPAFEINEYLAGELAPVFFGSAVNNFGVKELLDCFIEVAPYPKERETNQRVVNPMESRFSGFVFKIHANMDPRHRNRVAFVRVCSGKFERKKNYHHVRLGKNIRFSNATAFMAQEKEMINVAFPGDIVGLYDTGNLKIGDTLNEGEKDIFKGFPCFFPDIFKEVINRDAMK